MPYVAIPLLVTGMFLFITTMVIRAVPIQVDESIQYHVIACDFYKNAKYHTFWNPCDGSTNLNLLGIQLKRAYHYVGGFSSYFYYPFFRVSPSILTQRLIGVFFLIALVATITLLEPEKKLVVVVLFGLSFPLVYQLIDDTGPVRYSLFIAAFTPWFVGRIVRIRRKSVKAFLNIVLGFLLFFAVEDKPFFLYLVPSVLLLTIAYNCNNKQGVIGAAKLIVTEMLIALLVFGTLVYLYLIVARTNSGERYISELVSLVKPYSMTDELLYILSFMTNFEKFSSDVYEIRQFKVVNISFSLVIWLYGLIFVAKACKMGPSRKVVFTAIAFLVSIVVMLFTRNATTGHHYIFSYILGLLLVCQSMSYVQQNQNGFLILYSCFAIILAAELPFLAPNPTYSWERYKIFEYLRQENIARNYVIGHLSLGTYYVASLYGHEDQLSLQIRTLDSQTASKIISLADKVRRKILCVCRGPDCNAESLSSKFLNKVKFTETKLANQDWKVYLETGRTNALASNPASA